MPSSTDIQLIDSRLEYSISLKNILSHDYSFLGMDSGYYCFKEIDNTYSYRKGKDYNFIYADFDKKIGKFVVIAKVDLGKKKSSDRWGVDMVYVHSKHRGKNLAAKLYRYLITIHGFEIVSGSTQSPGGKHVWRSLSKFKDVDIRISTSDHKRKTNNRFVNGRYPSDVNIVDVVFIATRAKQKELVRYA
jgi:GNAT superfamily N-acetyltransferase